jgi:hypothetical protein
VSHRPLAIVSGLTIGDYLLWNWSLNGHHDALALVSGLTLPPLAVVLLWLVAVTVARVGAEMTRGKRERADVRTAAAAARRRLLDGSPAAASLGRSPSSPSRTPAGSPAASSTAATSNATSRKLAA